MKISDIMLIQKIIQSIIVPSMLQYRQIAMKLRSSHRRCSVKKVFLEISQNSQENTCARVSFLIKSLLSKSTFSYRTPPVIDLEIDNLNYSQVKVPSIQRCFQQKVSTLIHSICSLSICSHKLEEPGRK